MPANVYRFDASDAGPTDASAHWANDALTFNSSVSDRALNAGNGIGWLSGDGTTAPTTGDPITQVQWRVNAENLSGDSLNHEVREDSDSGAVLGSRSTSVAAAEWTTWADLTPPSAGWTWQKINDLSYRVQTNSASDEGGTYLVEIRVFSGELTHFYDSEFGTAGYLSTTYAHAPNTGPNPAQILGADLKANNKYLIVARALIGGNNAGAVNGHRIQTDDDSRIESKSESIVEVQTASTTALMSYMFAHSYITGASPADVGFQGIGYGGQESYLDQSSLLLLDLDALDVSSGYFDGTVSDPDSAWVNDNNIADGNLASWAFNGATTGSETADYIEVDGTSLLTTDDVGKSVHLRIAGFSVGTSEIGWAVRDGTTTLQTGTWVVPIGSPSNWSEDFLIAPPGGGWTATILSNLNIRIWRLTGQVDIAIAELHTRDYFEDETDPSSTDISQSVDSTILARILGADLGTDEYWTLGYGRYDIANAGKWGQVSINTALDTSSAAVRARHRAEGEDTDEQRVVGFSIRHQASSGTPSLTIFAQREGGGGGAHDVGGGYLIALPTALFADFVADYEAGSAVVDGTEVTIATSGSYTPSVFGNHLIFGRSNGDGPPTARGGMWVESTTTEIRIGDSGPTHNQIWDDSKDLEYMATFQRYPIVGAETLNLRARGVGADFDVEHRWLIIVNLSPPAPPAGGNTFETVTDDVGVTDSTSRIAPAVRAIAETVGVTDSIQVKQSKSIVDPVGVIDLIVDALTKAVSIVDPVGVTDSTSPAKTVQVSITESVGVTDSTPRISPATKTITEGVAVADAISDSETNRETLVETLGVTDSTTRAIVTRRSISDVGSVVAAETWGSGTGTDWTIAQGADFDWASSAERGTIALSIASGEGHVDGLFSVTSIIGVLVDGVSELDVEILTEVTVTDQDDRTGIGVLLRRSGVNTFYSLGIAHDPGVSMWGGITTNLNAVAIVKNVGGTRTSLAVLGTILANGDWWIRARIVGDKLKLKVWQGSEPAAWTLEATDSDLTGTEVGVHLAGNDGTSFDFSEFTVSEAFGVVGVTDDATPVKTIQEAISESLGVTDSTTFPLQITAEISETVGVTDSTPRVSPATKSIIEAVAVADAISDSETNRETLVETVGVTDSTTRITVTLRSNTDNVGVTDDTTPIKSITVAITEPVGVTDDATPIKSIQTEISETLGVIDSTTRVAPAVRSVVEAIAVADAISDSDTNRETLTEPVGVTDLIARLAPAIRSLVEAVGVTDVIAPVKTITVEITETLGVTDSTTHVLTIIRSIAEAVGVTDLVVDDLTAGGGDITESVTDPVGVTDTPTRIHAAVRSVVEPVGVTDSTTPAKSITVAVTETVGVTDSTTPAKTITVTISETLGVIDSTIRVHDVVRSVVEAIGVTDAIAPVKSITVAIAETMGVTDDTPFTLQIAVAISEDVGVTDSTTRVAPAVRPIVEGVAVQDAISDTETNRETLTEPVGITDLIARVHAALRTITDDADLTDLITAIKTIQIEISESLGLTDLISPASTMVREVIDPIGVTDSTAPAKTIQIEISEALGVADVVADALAGGLTEAVIDPVGITDSTTRAWTIVRSITETVGVTDLTIKGEVNEEAVAESVGVTDTTDPAKATTQALADDVGVTDSTESALSIVVTIDESVGVIDATARDMVAVRALVENVGVTTTLARVADWARILSDNVTVTDAVLAIDQAPSSLIPYSTAILDEPIDDVVGKVPADVTGEEF